MTENEREILAGMKKDIEYIKSVVSLVPETRETLVRHDERIGNLETCLRSVAGYAKLAVGAAVTFLLSLFAYVITHLPKGGNS